MMNVYELLIVVRYSQNSGFLILKLLRFYLHYYD